MSKRYIPELANYLSNLLQCFSSENSNRLLPQTSSNVHNAFIVPVTHPFSIKLKQSLSLYSYSKENEDIHLLK